MVVYTTVVVCIGGHRPYHPHRGPPTVPPARGPTAPTLTTHQEIVLAQLSIRIFYDVTQYEDIDALRAAFRNPIGASSASAAFGTSRSPWFVLMVCAPCRADQLSEQCLDDCGVHLPKNDCSQVFRISLPVPMCSARLCLVIAQQMPLIDQELKVSDLLMNSLVSPFID